MSLEELYLQNLRAIERVAGFVARRNNLGADEAAEFTQEVRVRLLEDNYGVLRKFEGRSSFTTYLTTVILRLYQQYRVEQWGKWRPSAEAKRLGDKAVTLERLTTRDGFTLGEAVRILTTPEGAQYTEVELEAIHARLPQRTPRPVMVSGEVAPDAISIDADAYDRVELADRERSARRAAAAVDAALQSMDPQDRLMLQMRFVQGLKVPDIARRLHVEQKKVYKRLDALFGRMRKTLEAAGLHRSEIRTLLNAESDLRFHILRGEEKITTRGPSHVTDGGS